MDKIVLYHQASCMQCRMVKDRLDKAHIEYESCMDIDYMLNKGIQGTPAIEVITKVVDENGNSLDQAIILRGKQMMDWLKAKEIESR